ncbi:aspartyl/asparaginyl beta-hydroxylase domain-containing protein [Amycolatopsis halotolerans]|uniref:Aspartyl/asparaginyl beta-hydroxylase domain-containing protein n=1 Tax=Amycolatopsis halotolerans TaxID=330083 RepID=A0ABV7QE38_9PSEU
MTSTSKSNLSSILTLPATAQLARSFDPERLIADLNRVTAASWIEPERYSEAVVEQKWRILPLVSIGGSVAAARPGRPGLYDFAKTPLAREAPYLTSIIDSLPGEVRTVRLIRMGPGGRLGEHRDRCGFDYGTLRLHVPIVTNPKAILKIGGEVHRWQPGSLWYGDFSRRHEAWNDGPSARVHLLLDTLITRELLDLFPAEFTNALSDEDVVFARPRRELSVSEAQAYECSFRMPKSFLEFLPGSLPELRVDEDEEETESVHLGVMQDRLILHIGGRPAFGLVALGDGLFRLLAGTEDRLLKIEPAGRRPMVRLQIRHGSEVRELSVNAIAGNLDSTVRSNLRDVEQ